MEKRVVLFLIISLLIVITYPYLIRNFISLPNNQIEDGGEEGIERDEEVAQKPREEMIEPIVEGTTEEKNITVETDLYRAVLSTKGGVIRSWKLKNYRDDPTQDNPNGEEIDLVANQDVENRPFSIFSDEIEEEGLYQVEGEDLHLEENERGTLRFLYNDPDRKVQIVKEYSFEAGTYMANLNIFINGISGGYTLSLGMNTGIHSWQKSFGGLIGPITRVNGENQSESLKKMEPVVNRSGLIDWVAQQDKYFLAAVLPQIPIEGSIQIQRLEESKMETAIVIPASEGDRSQKFGLYLGPKEYKRLKLLERHLEETINFGWFMFGSWKVVQWIAKPVFYALQFFYSFSNNYGVAIILVTCVIKGLFLPVTLKGMKSTKAMQEIQPKLTALRKKYEKDKEKLNRELIDLYKTHKINPLGGCLPVLLQLPVFVSLFNVLYVSIEMRHAPFVFWLHDLSNFDQFYILPVIYGITTYLLQRTTPTGMDPQQAKMFAMFIPVVTTMIFLNFPSGLVLYWVTNNLLSIGQQHLLGSMKKPQPVPSK